MLAVHGSSSGYAWLTVVSDSVELLVWFTVCGAGGGLSVDEQLDDRELPALLLGLPVDEQLDDRELLALLLGLPVVDSEV